MICLLITAAFLHETFQQQLIQNLILIVQLKSEKQCNNKELLNKNVWGKQNCTSFQKTLDFSLDIFHILANYTTITMSSMFMCNIHAELSKRICSMCRTTKRGMLSVGQTDNFRPIRADKILKRNERNLFFSRFWVANPQTNAHLAELKQEKIYFTEYHR